MRNLDELTTREMTDAEWKRFIKEWKAGNAEFLVIELGMSKKEAKEQAEYEFERYSGQEGYTGRDEMISMKREFKKDQERAKKWEEEGDGNLEAEQERKAEQNYEFGGLLVNAADDDDCPF
jgi:hypothetical protein|tara:strand:- start:4259 stop:4621 length:363 start_codon:yes stop_codon:yes gene_type:complete